jgi:hypothetical protein
MQHHAGRSVIWPPVAVQTHPSSSAAAALDDKFISMNCDRQLMTDPCICALPQIDC